MRFDLSSSESASLHWAGNLKKVKIVVLKWAFDKRSKYEQALILVEKEITEIYSRDYVTNFEDVDRIRLKSLENTSRKLLQEKEAWWRLKRKAL